MRKLFGTDGIRAVAGEAPLDPRTIYAVGLALAHTLSRHGVQPRVVLGMDTRESSEWIGATIAAGLGEGGATVESAGVITTPGVASPTPGPTISDAACRLLQPGEVDAISPGYGGLGALPERPVALVRHAGLHLGEQRILGLAPVSLRTLDAEERSGVGVVTRAERTRRRPRVPAF